jgi:transposase
LKRELLHPLPSPLRAAVEREWRRLEVENELLKEEVKRLRMAKYGVKSDQLNEEQLSLLDEEPGVVCAEVESEGARREEEKQDAARQKRQPRQHPGRAELPAHLERIESILACTPEQCRCGQCGGEKKLIGYDTSEELDVKPAQYFVNVIKREKRACGQCEELGVSTAAAPQPKIVEKGKASNAVVVDVILKKYCDHTPLYRQSAILEREAGIELSRMTLCGWVMQGGMWLEAIRDAMRVDLLSGQYIQADETPVGVQSERRVGKNHCGYLWQYSRPGGPVIFDFQMGRSREGPARFLGKFNGFLQSDGYGAYDKIGGEGIVHAGCMAHLRRGFVDALKLAPGNASAEAIVAVIAELYAVEKRAREAGMSAEDRKRLRQTESVPTLERLKKQIVGLRQDVLPKSALGKACDYALRQWSRVEVYANHGEVEIDNNWCENAMRPVALGRKNWLHIGSEEAGPRIAAISSVIETCRRLGINVRDYLLDVLPRIPTWPAKRVAELTPMAWAAQRPSR